MPSMSTLASWCLSRTLADRTNRSGKVPQWLHHNTCYLYTTNNSGEVSESFSTNSPGKVSKYMSPVHGRKLRQSIKIPVTCTGPIAQVKCHSTCYLYTSKCSVKIITCHNRVFKIPIIAICMCVYSRNLHLPVYGLCSSCLSNKYSRKCQL